MEKEEQVTMTGTVKEMEVIRILREIDYGKIIITVKEGKPVHAETQKSIQLK